MASTKQHHALAQHFLVQAPTGRRQQDPGGSAAHGCAWGTHAGAGALERQGGQEDGVCPAPQRPTAEERRHKCSGNSPPESEQQATSWPAQARPEGRADTAPQACGWPAAPCLATVSTWEAVVAAFGTAWAGAAAAAEAAAVAVRGVAEAAAAAVRGVAEAAAVAVRELAEAAAAAVREAAEAVAAAVTAVAGAAAVAVKGMGEAVAAAVTGVAEAAAVAVTAVAEAAKAAVRAGAEAVAMAAAVRKREGWAAAKVQEGRD